MIYPEPLTLQHCAYLAPRIRQADRDDLKDHKAGPEKALALALVTPGEAWAVIDGSTGLPIGAGGWTEEGVVWTLWVDLTLSQAKDLMRMVVPYARILAIRARRPLHNWYRSSNSATIRFLRATGCVSFTDERVAWGLRTFQLFYLKPLEELPNV